MLTVQKSALFFICVDFHLLNVTFNITVFLWGPYLMAAAPCGRGSLLLYKLSDQKCPFQELVWVIMEDPTFRVHHC